jgi:2-enoate reductase
MKLFEPGWIGTLRLKNRLAMAPMAIGGLVEPDGRFSEQAIAYYRERARGGTGLIITGLATVESEIEKNLLNGWAAFPRMDSGAYVPRLSKLADAIHDYGARLAIQLTAGFGRVAPQFLIRQGRPPAPSVVPCFHNPKESTREMTLEEIQRMVKAFATAARVAQSAGADAVELHGHEGYLLDQFKTALWNKRTDRYGGDLEGRLRFPQEVIAAIKKATGQNFPLIYRVGLDHYLEGGRTLEEGVEVARRLESFGVDALHVDAGCYESWDWAHPPLYHQPGCLADMAAAAKQAVKVPVIAVGRLGYPELAEQLLQEGKADFIALGRALLADPEWPEKVRLKHAQDIRPCIGDHEGCLGRTFKGKPLSCSVNPAVGLEDELKLSPAAKPLRVLVVGGGPAGMEAARVAAIRGHEVSLLEQRDRLGGTLIPGAVPAFKKDLQLLTDYFKLQLPKVGVEIKLRQEATPQYIMAAGAEVVIIATGAKPLMPELPGVAKPHVVSAVDLLMGKVSPAATANVIVLGGGEVGCETAVHIAERGCRVTLIETLPQVLHGVFNANRLQLLRMMQGHQVRVLANTCLQEIRDGSVLARSHDGAIEEIPATLVVVAIGSTPRTELFTALSASLPRVHAIGDCVTPRSVFEAFSEAYRLARLI